MTTISGVATINELHLFKARKGGEKKMGFIDGKVTKHSVPATSPWDSAHPSRAKHMALASASKDHLCNARKLDERSCTTRSSSESNLHGGCYYLVPGVNTMIQGSFVISTESTRKVELSKVV